MATGCVSTPDSGAKQRLQAAVQEGSCNYQEVNLSDGGPEMNMVMHDVGNNKVCVGVVQHGGDQLKKPRRKDTPVLNAPPHIPGGRLMMEEKRTIYLEDEEKDGKD